MGTTTDARSLTVEERRLAASMFGDAIDYDCVKVHRRCWWPLQGLHMCMAPDGHMWFHPRSPLWCKDFSSAHPGLKGLFIHEMTHVWQAQQRGRWYLPLMRHPFCRYGYELRRGKPFAAYGIEQQAEIVRHGFLLRSGAKVPGAAELEDYEHLLPFTPGPPG